jgi:hypothetical protein
MHPDRNEHLAVSGSFVPDYFHQDGVGDLYDGLSDWVCD